jgi:hypothetical protein
MFAKYQTRAVQIPAIPIGFGTTKTYKAIWIMVIGTKKLIAQ